MEEIAGQVLHRALRIVSELECELLHMKPTGDAAFPRSSAHLTDKHRQNTERRLEFPEVALYRMGLSNSAQAVSDFRLQLRLFNGRISNVLALERVRELNRAIEHTVRLRTVGTQHGWKTPKHPQQSCYDMSTRLAI